MPKFPTKMVLHYEDGTQVTFQFKDPKASATGKMNAHAGGKYTEGSDKYQIGCNVTLCKPKKEKADG
ncbi:MAG: hypothetical protein GY906_12850 [bacterium]|nr:hypothetical protein [bacterium]